LHSFFYEEARRGFADVAAKAPGCALAQLGRGDETRHPIWTPPSDGEREAGRAAIDARDGRPAARPRSSAA
jgi:hypothetical protein